MWAVWGGAVHSNLRRCEQLMKLPIVLLALLGGQLVAMRVDGFDQQAAQRESKSGSVPKLRVCVFVPDVNVVDLDLTVDVQQTELVILTNDTAVYYLDVFCDLCCELFAP